MSSLKILCVNCSEQFDATNIKCPKCGFPMRKLYMDSENHIEDIVNNNTKNQYEKLDVPISKKESEEVVSESIRFLGETFFLTKAEVAFKLCESIEKQNGTRFYKDVVDENSEMLTNEFKYYENLSGKGRKVWNKLTSDVISKVFNNLSTKIRVPDTANILKQESTEEIRDNVLGYLYNATDFESRFEVELSEISQVRSQLLNNPG